MKKFLLIFCLMFFTLSFSQNFSGTWKMTPEAGAFGVGPYQGSFEWWSNSTADVTSRACFFDDEYIFNADGTFQNVLGNQTWLEQPWQQNPQGCGTPIAPHNGANAATWVYNSSNNTITISGVGAYLGIAKAYNGGELSNSANAPASITYTISSLTSGTMTLDINSGAAWWRFKMTKSDALPTCSDGIQNGTETGVDCGGTCTACLETIPPAPNPTIAESSAITIYSDSGTLDGSAVPINTFRTGWSSASLEEVPLSGNYALKYTSLGFVGIEANSNPIDASNMNGFHLDVYTATATTFSVKLVDYGANAIYGGGDDREHQVSFSTEAGWNSKDLLLATFTGLTTRGHIAQIIFVGTGTAYVDNIYFKYEEVQVPTSPVVAAPTPPARNAWDVVSFFSDAYTNQGADFNPYWGQSTVVSQVAIQGNTTMKYANLNYQGVQFNTDANVASMTKLHIDVWTPDATAFEVFLIGGGENGFTLFPSQAGWNSFDIDMSNYAARTLTNIIQFKFVGTPFGSSTVFYDNLYFWRPQTSLPSPTLSSFSVPNKFVGDQAFELTSPLSNSNGAFTYTSSNAQVATISGSTVTIIGAGTTVITATQAESSAYGVGTITANFVVSYLPPATAAPTPTIPSNRVLSVFSDAYTNVSNTEFFPYWGQNPSVIGATVSIDNNSTLKYERLSYQGIQLGSPINVSDMTTLHLNMWTPDCTSFDVYLINPGVTEQKVTLTPNNSGWNTFAISLAEYTNIALNSVGQFKFVASPSGSTVYLDNIYFSKPCSANITTQPATPTICKLTGATASISVASAAADSPTYQWQMQTTSSTTVWTPIVNNANYSGATSATLNITRSSTSLPVTGTKYRVIVTSCGSSVTSNQVALAELATLSKAATITAKSATNTTLSPALTTCESSSVTLTLGANSVGNIQWQSSTDGTNFTNFGSLIQQSVLSAVNLAMSKSSGNLTQDTWFRVVATNGVCNSATSAAIKITVSTTPTAGSISGGNVTVCAPVVAPSTTVFDATGSALTTSITNSTTLSLTGNSSTSIVWQKSINFVNTTNATPVWSTVAGATTSDLVVSNLAADTWFRAFVTNGACVSFTEVVKITVSKSAKAGTVTAPTTVCSGGSITFTSAPYTGSAIAWQVSTTSATSGFETVVGANGLEFTMNNVTLVQPGQKFYVRSVVTSGACTQARSAVKTVTMDRVAVAAVITGNTGVTTSATAICTTATKTLTLGVGYVGTIQWQKSTTSATEGFDDITGATARTYAASSTSAGNVWFRVKLSSGLCSVAYSTPVNVWFKSCTTRQEAPITTFAVKGYPNPYNTNFTLSLDTLSDAMVYVSVYDMTGKLIENREVMPSALEDLQLGSNWAIGVYNVIVAQDNQLKTMRMIKK